VLLQLIGPSPLEATPRKRLGILLSGRGSNFLAIAGAIEDGSLTGCEIALVLSNRVAAPGLDAARDLGVPAIAVPARGRSRDEHDRELIARLMEYRVDLVCLAGYMRIVGPEFVRAFPQRMLNVHPSLLPAFKGLDAQQQALDYGARVAGCTVHFVDEDVDHGVIVLQRTVAVEDDDTPESLAARILVEEHRAYPDAIARVLSGEFAVHGRRYMRTVR
jgi:phosphoribosylglycinamide formyltransferase-1